jgi:hypothetical protein
MNKLLEEYRWNIIAAGTGQTDVLPRDRWAHVFLLMAREVGRLQTIIDAKEQGRTFEDMRQEAMTEWANITERTGE